MERIRKKLAELDAKPASVRRSHRPRLVQQEILRAWLSGGYSLAELAGVAGVSYETIRRWVKRWKASGQASEWGAEFVTLEVKTAHSPPQVSMKTTRPEEKDPEKEELKRALSALKAENERLKRAKEDLENREPSDTAPLSAAALTASLKRPSPEEADAREATALATAARLKAQAAELAAGGQREAAQELRRQAEQTVWTEARVYFLETLFEEVAKLPGGERLLKKDLARALKR